MEKINFERIYPFLLSVILTITINLLIDFTSLPPEFEQILAGVINFTSIILGFLGVLLAILLSLRDTELIQFIFSKINRNLLKLYFKEAMFIGIFLVIISLASFLNHNLYLTIPKLANSINIMFLIWSFSIFYFLLSSFRIIDIVMHIIFIDPNKTNTTPKPEELSPEQKKELDELYPINESTENL